MTEFRDRLDEVRGRIKNQTRNIIMSYDTPSTISVTKEVSDLNDFVHVRLCSLDCDDVTVVNVEFGEGGEIKPHSHDRVERIYVIDGCITDKVNGKTFREGEVYTIPRGVVHHIVSDYALLTVTWKPAFN